MLSQVKTKLQEAKEYCISQCKKKDEITGKWVVDEEAKELYNKAFKDMDDKIQDYTNSIDFDTMFQSIIMSNVYLSQVDQQGSIEDMWKYFGGEVYNKILAKDKVDFFTGLTSTSVVDNFVDELGSKISSDASARRSKNNSMIQPLLIDSLTKTFAPPNVEKMTTEAKQKINERIQKIFYDAKFKEIIEDYKVSNVQVPSFIPIVNN